MHFCDDPGGGRSDHPELAGGGAFQVFDHNDMFQCSCGSPVKVSLARLQLDYYPYHLARGERKHWVRYPADSPHRAWLQVGGLESQLWSKLNLQSGLAQFDTRLLDELLSGQNKAPLSRCKSPKKFSYGVTCFKVRPCWRIKSGDDGRRGRFEGLGRVTVVQDDGCRCCCSSG